MIRHISFAALLVLLTVAPNLSVARTPASAQDSPGNAAGSPPINPNLTLHSVHKLYIERMPNGLDDFLRTAIFKKCGGFFTIVLNRPEADAILKVNDPRLPGNVVMVDQSGSLVLWSGSADKKEAKFLDLRKGGEKVLAEKLAGQLKKAID